MQDRQMQGDSSKPLAPYALNRFSINARFLRQAKTHVSMTEIKRIQTFKNQHFEQFERNMNGKEIKSKNEISYENEHLNLVSAENVTLMFAKY